MMLAVALGFRKPTLCAAVFFPKLIITFAVRFQMDPGWKAYFVGK